jgi:hypothetical protein
MLRFNHKRHVPMRCFLCGATEQITADHIPPKGFFPPEQRLKLITVPCCKSCNASFSKDDEAIRLWMSSTLGRSDAGDWIFNNKSIRTAEKSSAFREKMLSSMQEIKLLTEEGEIDAIELTVPIDRVERFILRISKGLLTHYCPEYDYENAEFRIDYIPSRVDILEKIAPIRDRLIYGERWDGVFQFRMSLTESKQSGLWLLLFYDSVMFLVSHTKNRWGSKI